ncbi:hypothetical protein ACFXO9_26950 [Nocardia tengchongensis]|uniref:hypothetical protein n=1 Tax=Nocardia tengchongensis TaxID=2055889 RepID=UPI00367B701B
MTDLMGSIAHELLVRSFARYGSIDVFIARLHALLDMPAVVALRRGGASGRCPAPARRAHTR